MVGVEKPNESASAVYIELIVMAVAARNENRAYELARSAAILYYIENSQEREAYEHKG